MVENITKSAKKLENRRGVFCIIANETDCYHCQRPNFFPLLPTTNSFDLFANLSKKDVNWQDSGISSQHWAAATVDVLFLGGLHIINSPVVCAQESVPWTRLFELELLPSPLTLGACLETQIVTWNGSVANHLTYFFASCHILIRKPLLHSSLPLWKIKTTLEPKHFLHMTA